MENIKTIIAKDNGSAAASSAPADLPEKHADVSSNQNAIPEPKEAGFSMEGEKRKYLIRMDDGDGAVVMAEGEDSAILLFGEELDKSRGRGDWLCNADVDEVTGPVFRVVTEYNIHLEFVFAAATPEEAKQKAIETVMNVSWEKATILSITEERVLGAEEAGRVS